VFPHRDNQLLNALQELINSDLIFGRGTPPEATYTFKHALVQDAAYQSVLKTKLHHFHAQIGSVLQAKFPETVASQPELLAHHYTEAGIYDQAITHWLAAGKLASSHSAYHEALAHLTKAQQLIAEQPDTPERAQFELDLCLMLGAVYQVTKGWGAPEVEDVFTRARDLCHELDDEERLVFALWGPIGVSVVRAEFQKTRTLSNELLQLAERRGDSVYITVAHFELAGAAFGLAELPLSKQHFEKGIELYDKDPNQHQAHIPNLAIDIGVIGRAWAAHPIWQLGHVDQARTHGHEAIALAEQLLHPYSQALSLAYGAVLYQFCHDVEKAYELANTTVELSSEHGFLYYLAWGRIVCGWASAMRTQESDGIELIRQGIDYLRETEVRRSMPYYWALLAEALNHVGQNDQGCRALEAAFEAQEVTGECWWEPELLRLKGVLRLHNTAHDDPDVETCFHDARHLASQRQARSLELRATISLARLWRDQGQQNDAQLVLKKAYDWFTEGGDTADLMDAKALLDELK
jgi:predicted ATPase